MNDRNFLVATLLENLNALSKEADAIFSRNELIEMFCRRILPVLKEHPRLEPLRTKWRERREELNFEIQKTEKDAFNESVSAFRKIERALKNAKIPTSEKITKQLKIINQILSGEERYCSPPLYRVVFDEIRILFYLLLEEGHEDVCRRFAKINTQKTYVQEDQNAKDQYGDWDENGNFKIFTEDKTKLLSDGEKTKLCRVSPKMKLVDQSYIETFEFCPSYVKTFSANKAASVDRIHDAAVVWWYFESTLQYWNTPASFFDKSIPKQNTKKSCENYFKCLCDLKSWREIAGARDSKFHVESPVIFTESLFKKGMRTIIAEIRDYCSKGYKKRGIK